MISKRESLTATRTSVPPEAHALTIFRAGNNGDGISYSAVTFPKDPYAGCERSVRMFQAVGYISDSFAVQYAVLDVLDKEGDIIADFTIPDAHGFQGIKKKLGLVVEPIE